MCVCAVWTIVYRCVGHCRVVWKKPVLKLFYSPVPPLSLCRVYYLVCGGMADVVRVFMHVHCEIAPRCP